MRLIRKTSITIFTSILMSCGSENSPSDSFPSDCVAPHIDQIKGTWAYYDKSDGYSELEISDSLYWYVDQGHYIGPVVPLPYTLDGDSLFTLYDDGDKDRGWKICYQDSITIRIKNQFSYYVCKKINPRLKISDWTEKDTAIYDKEFLGRKREFSYL